MLEPEIGAVLRGTFTSYSAEDSEIAGFRFGHESERAPEGFSVGHSELSLSGDVGDAARASLVLGIGAHPGEPAELELEEAYVQTLPGLGLTENFTVTAGRKLWSFGYLNERHSHEDDFADRPLPYRAFLDNGFNDDGFQLSLALPGDVRTEFGGGLFRGDDQPFGGSDNGRRALSAYARIGGDLGSDSSWGIGASLLSGEVVGGGHAHDEHGHDDEHDEDMDHHDEEDHHDDEMDDHDDEHGDEMDDHDDEHADEHADEHGHDDEMTPASIFSDGVFSGDRALFGTDIRFAWAPTGNARQSEVILQGEYLWQTDDGVYTLEDDEMEEHDADRRRQERRVVCAGSLQVGAPVADRRALCASRSAERGARRPRAERARRHGRLDQRPVRASAPAVQPGIAGARRGGRPDRPAIHGEPGRARRPRPLRLPDAPLEGEAGIV